MVPVSAFDSVNNWRKTGYLAPINLYQFIPNGLYKGIKAKSVLYARYLDPERCYYRRNKPKYDVWLARLVIPA